MPQRPNEPLTRTAVLEAGIALADRDGVSAVTMRRLGDLLGVEAMSLYNHVAGKQDVLDGMATLLLTRMEPVQPRPDETWQSVLREMCWTYRRLITDHPNVFVTQAGRPQLSDASQPVLSRIMKLLTEAGFPEDVALDLFLTGSTFTRGFALSDIAYRASDVPTPAGWDSDRAFQRGINAILEGFSHLWS